MARSVCSVLIFMAYIIVSFVCITSLTSGREIPSKRLGYNITPLIIHLQHRKTEDHNNEEQTLYTLNRNRRTIGTARGLLGRIFNSIFQRRRPITTDEPPIPTDGPIFPTDIPILPTNVARIPKSRPLIFTDTSESGNNKIPQAPFVSEHGGLTVIPAPVLVRFPEPTFLKQASFSGNIL